jgi:hypothetical protein
MTINKRICVKNIHTAAIAGLRPGQTGEVDAAIYERFIRFLAPILPKEPEAIEQLEDNQAPEILSSEHQGESAAHDVPSQPKPRQTKHKSTKSAELTEEAHHLLRAFVVACGGIKRAALLLDVNYHTFRTHIVKRRQKTIALKRISRIDEQSLLYLLTTPGERLRFVHAIKQQQIDLGDDE